MIIAGMEFAIGIALAILLIGAVVRIATWARQHPRDTTWLAGAFFVALAFVILMAMNH